MLSFMDVEVIERVSRGLVGTMTRLASSSHFWISTRMILIKMISEWSTCQNMEAYRRHGASPATELTVHNDWYVRVTHGDVNEICQVREVWRTFCSNGYSSIFQLDTTDIFAGCHDVLQD